MGEIRQAASPEAQPWWWRLAPVWVNCLMGVPAMVPLHSAWLLLTEYRSCAFDNSGVGLTDCGGFDAIEGAGWARVGVVIFGGLGLLLVILLDVLLPAARGRRLRPWLLAMLLIPIPYLGTVAGLSVLR
jgi:hypothetical protein